jgi:hypothetical protein
MTDKGDSSRTSPMKTRDLATATYLRLPRELRNRIYTFCVESSYDNQVIVRHTAYPKPGLAFLMRERYGRHAYQWIEDPIRSLISIHNLGWDVAKEMLETYYWTRTFRFSHRELPLMASFLETDHFGLGILPATYARRLYLHIQPDILARLPSCDEWRKEELKCLAAITTLGVILTARTEIYIDMEVAEVYDEPERPSTQLAVSFTGEAVQAVKALEGRGLRIRMRCKSNWWD